MVGRRSGEVLDAGIRVRGPGRQLRQNCRGWCAATRLKGELPRALQGRDDTADRNRQTTFRVGGRLTEDDKHRILRFEWQRHDRAAGFDAIARRHAAARIRVPKFRSLANNTKACLEVDGKRLAVADVVQIPVIEATMHIDQIRIGCGCRIGEVRGDAQHGH